MKKILVILMPFLLSACVTVPPRDVNNICSIFNQYPHWYKDAKGVERRWNIPVPVQMAIIHQESKFDANAQPPRKKLLNIIPWNRPSTAYGYTQALKSTWALYKLQHGNFFTSRDDFGDGVNFIGWYAYQANKRAGISPRDPYNLYLAYHEGVGGYQKHTYLAKPWLMAVATKVKYKAELYGTQLASCR